MRLSRPQTLLIVAALATIIVATRVALVATYAHSIPWWEEWDILIDGLARGFASGGLGIADLFAPNNEHTIFFTKLVFVAALALNHGQFDNVPVALFDAFLAAAVWCVPAWLFFRRAPAGIFGFACLFAVIGAIPLGWVDAMHGFQNQFYFVLLGTLFCLWFAASLETTRPSRIAAFAIAAAVATASMGPGLLAPAIAAGVMLLRRRHSHERAHLFVIGAAAGLAIALIGVWLFLHAERAMTVESPSASNGEPFWVIRILTCAAWPYANSASVGLLVSLPFCFFAWRLLRRGSLESMDWFVFGFGLWLAGQIGAMAIYRHIVGDTLPNRYLDVVVFWPLMNLYALLREMASAAPRRWFQPVPVTVAVGMLFALGTAARVPANIEGIARRAEWLTTSSQRVANYLRGDAGAFEAPGFPPAPYWAIPRLKTLLDDPAVREVLPASIRKPLPLQVDSPVAAAAFVPGGFAPDVAQPVQPAYGSYILEGEHNAGIFRSLPMQTQWPYLILDVVGDLPAAGLALSIGSKSIRPVAGSPQEWRQIVKHAPAHDFRIEAETAAGAKWFAFTAPREAGRLSALAARTIDALREHALLAATGVILLASFLLLAAWRWREVDAD